MRLAKSSLLSVVCKVAGGIAVAFGSVAPAQGATTTIAATGQQPGGTPAGTEYTVFDRVQINNAGQVAYRAFLGGTGVDPGNDRGIWRDDNLIAREGDPAPGIAGDVNFGDLGSIGGVFVILSDTGEVTYHAELTGADVTSADDESLWRNNTLVARTSDDAPGTSDDAIFANFNAITQNAIGQTAHHTRLDGPGVSTNNDRGIWRNDTKIAREGDSVVPIGSGVSFDAINDSPVLNDAGDVGFSATVTGTGVTSANNETIWRNNTLLAREGDTAPGTAGRAFSSFNNSLRINNAGQVAFVATIAGAGVTPDNDRGIWRDGTLVAREGDPAPPAAGPGVNFANLTSPLINNAGQVLYTANLTGPGVNVSNDTTLWRNNELVAREGDPAPGLGGGLRFFNFTDLAINDGGQVAHKSLLLGTEGVLEADSLWITGPNDQSLLIVRTGDTLPGGTVDFVTFQGSTGGSDGRARGLNDFSQVAYRVGYTSGGEAVLLFTPDIHWNTPGPGAWDNADNWTIGQRPGDPHDVFIDPTASLTVLGPAGNPTVNNLTVGGNNGIATLALNGGAIHSPNPVHVTNTGELTGDGVVDADVNNDGTVLADNVTILGALNNNGLIAGSGRINAQLNNTTEGEVRAGPGDHLVFNNTGHTNDGRIEVIGTAFETARIEFNGSLNNNAPDGSVFAENATLDFDGGMTNEGRVNVTFGTSRVFGDLTNAPTGRIVLSGNSNTTFFDDLENNGLVQVGAGSTAVYFGTVTGTGSFLGTGTNVFEGTFSPGASPGLVDFGGDVALGHDARLNLEIAGSTPGTQHDHLAIDGTLHAAGTLTIALLDGHTPQPGDTYNLFNFTAAHGAFRNLTLPTLPHGLTFDTTALLTTGALTVVPEPAAASLLALGILFLFNGRRNHPTTPST